MVSSGLLRRVALVKTSNLTLLKDILRISGVRFEMTLFWHSNTLLTPVEM
jgi:hypothetical protein